MQKLAYAPLKRILSETGCRVSEDAVKELEQILTSFATEISTEAARVAKHAGRSTIRADDIQLVL